MSYPFEPRRWQRELVRDYQILGKKNYFLEACTSAGKTAAAIYAYMMLMTAFGWDFFIAVVPSEHLMKQYAQDAQNLFGLKFYYSGTDKRLGRIPTINELISKGYDGLIVSYQWLSISNGENARTLRQSIESSSANKIFLVLDEVHHVSDQLSYGQACEIAFPDEIISHRLMTSGTPFRSDGKRILGGWIDYQHDETTNQYIYKPDFSYKLVNALDDGIIPHFSFVTLGGEFSYRNGEAIYEGKRFETEENEENLPKLLNTAILVDGVWVETAIEWAHQRMKRDRQNGFPECATYVRVPKIETAYKMQKRIYEITNQEALVVVSQDDPSFSSNFKQQGDPSQLIENFAAETGHSATSWIIGVGMLGEGISIKRLKYRIHATNICARLSFEQDLGRLLRKFPEDNPQPVETLIPSHPYLRVFALEIMNEVSEYFIRESEQKLEDRESESSSSESSENPISSIFQPISSTGEFDSHIVDGKEISNEYTAVAEWAIVNHPLGQGWGKTPAHLADVFQQTPALFEVIRAVYDSQVANEGQTNNTPPEDIPPGFSPKYGTWLADKKTKHASQQAHKKAQRLAYLLLPKNSNTTEIDMGKQISKIHVIAKQQNGIKQKGFIDYQDYEKIYLWLCDKVAQAELKQIRTTEDL